jgi:DNA-binding LacI/PurR family transcriptional regulator
MVSGLSVAAISRVLNGVPAAKSIPKATQERIFAAAALFNYRPNVLARSLRRGHSMTIGVLVPEVSEGYATLMLAGLEQALLQAGYFYFLISHHHREELIERSQRMLAERTVDGIIAVDTPLHHHLHDVSAIGAFRALREAGSRVPHDVSVVGFDDVQSAAFQNPGLTTVRQPLRTMGMLAGESLVRQIAASAEHSPTKQLMVDPEFVVRESTCPPQAKKTRRR